MIWILLNLFYPTKDMILTVAGHLSRGTCDPVSIIFVFQWTYWYGDCCWKLKLLWTFICLLGCSFNHGHPKFYNNRRFLLFEATFWYQLTFDGTQLFFHFFFFCFFFEYQKKNVYFYFAQPISRQYLIFIPPENHHWFSDVFKGFKK